MVLVVFFGLQWRGVGLGHTRLDFAVICPNFAVFGRTSYLQRIRAFDDSSRPLIKLEERLDE